MFETVNKLLISGILAVTPLVYQPSPVYFTETQLQRLDPVPPASPLPSPIAISSPVPVGEVTVGGPVDLETPTGILRYTKVWKHFWATSYDSTCLGCDMVTATGMKQGYGVVAVDPKVIPLYSKLYIPGYGVAVAGDVGGGIKGARIDLGFDTLEGQWSSGWVDIYLLVE